MNIKEILLKAFEAGREYQEYKSNINLEEKSWDYTFDKWYEKQVKLCTISHPNNECKIHAEKAIIKKHNLNEFKEKCLWFFGWVDKNGEPCYEKNTFVQIERKYFEGFNLPRKIINGKMESFNDSYNRMKRWFDLSIDEKIMLK